MAFLTVFKKIIKKLIYNRYIKVSISMPNRRTKIYNSFDEASKECKTEGGYENNELCEMIGDKTQDYINNLNKKTFMLDRNNNFPILAIHNFLLESSTSNINIIDIGGACGARYFEVRRFFPSNIKFKWWVVDTPEMVKSAKNHGLENEELLFVDNVGVIEYKIDFVYCSGCLQYVDYRQFLPRLMEFNPKYMLFQRTEFNENNRDLFFIQQSRLFSNGPQVPPREKYKDKEIFYPCTIIAFNNFLNIIQTKYTLEWSYEDGFHLYQINNEKLIRGGLLFKRTEKP